MKDIPNSKYIDKYLIITCTNKDIEQNAYILGPPQVKCRLLISSIFYVVMNFWHFSEMP